MYITSNVAIPSMILILVFLFSRVNRKRIALLLLASLWGYEFYGARQVGTGVVVITGASSGLGRACALELAAQEGIEVWATVRKASDVISLETEAIEKGVRGLHVAIADITKQDQMDSLVERLTRFTADKAPLLAVIANAGVSGGGSPLEVEKEEQFRHVYEVNTIGTWRTARSFLPLLRASSLDNRSTVVPRFVYVSSVLGGVVLAGTSQYSGSKAAAEAVAVGIRRELHPLVHSTVVRPGFFKTSIQETASLRRKDHSHVTEDHKSVYKTWWQKFLGNTLGGHVDTGRSPSEACPALIRASLSRYPPNVIYVGGPEINVFMLAQFIPEPIFDYIGYQVNKVR